VTIWGKGRAGRSGKVACLNVTLDEGLADPITLSLSKGENRSGFLAEAALEHLAKRSARA
jgi:hypothetical protein